MHKAGAVLAGGHLRSQQRYRASETGRAFDDPEVLSITRNSNSMDVALLAGDLVALLERYGAALVVRTMPAICGGAWQMPSCRGYPPIPTC